MSRTHSGEVTKAATKLARWLTDRTKSRGVAPPSTLDIMTQVRQRWAHPKFDPQDQIAIGRAALAIFKRNDPEGWEKFTEQNPDVCERPAAT